MLPVKIGRYHIQQKIGQGNTADVYRASSSDSDQTVVLKVARPDERQEEWVAQLRQEASILSGFMGTGIPKFYGYFESDGYSYNVLEHIEGHNLDTVLAGMTMPLDERDAIQWGLRICDILVRLHNQQPQPLIYRFIGPDNLMLDHKGELYVIDYGKVSPYVPGQDYPRLGEIGYSAPELYVGRPEPRSDIYGLGVLLYHATTQRDPRRPNEAFLFHVNPPRSLNPRLSEAFEIVILKAVEHKAADRYPTAEAMKAALLAC
jgi:serine/threonine-protein kinase